MKKQYEIETDERVAKLSNEDLFYETLNAQQGDDWDGMFTKSGAYEAKATKNELIKRLKEINFLPIEA